MNQDTPARPSALAVAAVVVPCASRKRLPADDRLSAGTLSAGPQTRVAAQWRRRRGATIATLPAREMYMGRGFDLGRRSAETSVAPLFVVSAGLGLVAADQPIPSYDLTVSGRGDESIQQKVSDGFDAAAWWADVRGGPFSAQWADVVAGEGVILLALSQNYARLVGDDLAGLSTLDRARLRLFGIGLAGVLPAELAPQVMPYDDRLDAIFPGTRTDFAQRALAHFVAEISIAGDALEHATAVTAALAGYSAPRRPHRPRASDVELLGIIRRRLRSSQGIARVLGEVRREDKVACEQRRFTRLYRLAQQHQSAR